jgi:hypothetical protein
LNRSDLWDHAFGVTSEDNPAWRLETATPRQTTSNPERINKLFAKPRIEHGNESEAAEDAIEAKTCARH